MALVILPLAPPISPADPSVARPKGHVAAHEPLPAVNADPSVLWNLGVHGIPLSQYLRWADDLGLFTAMADGDVITIDDIVARTPLTARGADGLLGIVCSLQLAQRVGDDGYRLCDVAREYLDRRRPFYLGPSLYGMLAAPLPPQLCKGQAVRHYSRFTGTIRDWWRYMRKPNQFGRREQLMAQHRRNLPVNAMAAQTGLFDGVRHLADIGGGSGAFAIPLALRDPSLRITLVDLPRATQHVGPFLEPHGLQERIAVLGCNVHQTPWPLHDCDGVLFGNFMHFCSDDECLALLRESHRILPPGGRLFVHEMLWNDRRDGPIATALWSFWMGTISAGRQRTACEFDTLLRQAGFRREALTATSGGFSLMAATKS